MTLSKFRTHSLVVLMTIAALATGCGGGGGNDAPAASTSSGAASGPASTTAGSDGAAAETVAYVDPTPETINADLEATLNGVEVKPSYRLAPVILPEPSDVDRVNPQASSLARPQRLGISAQAVSTAGRFNADDLLAGNVPRLATAQAVSQSVAAQSTVTPQDTRVYTPAQIRAAYGLPALPTSYTGLTDEQAASLGAGQTIFIINAFNNLTIAADLAAFSTKFGLPQCKTVPVAVTVKMPLADAKIADGCTFSQIYIAASGERTAKAPAYNANWADEIALDVQWSHAIAPLARIVLVQSETASLTTMARAIETTNTMGKGIVSMSFGIAEASWGPTIDWLFTQPGMTYVAAAGDFGYQSMWPSSSSHVLAVGGTSLYYDGTSRTEKVWSGSGGGVSTIFEAPAYQASTGLNQTMRTPADVSFNADPATGQVTARSSGSTRLWLAYGGTSISAPQWAGLLAITNAKRALKSRYPLQAVHDTIYQAIGAGSTVYGDVFLDVQEGANGDCELCSARKGYDLPTGHGTPNTAALFAQLATFGAAVPSPEMAGATLFARVASPLQYQFKATQVDNTKFTYSLVNAPKGVTIDAATGLLKWAAPLVGEYTFSVKAVGVQNTSVTAAVTLQVGPKNNVPKLAAATVTGEVGKSFSLQVAASDADGDKLAFAVTGMPTGMTMSETGLLEWATPVVGSYSITVGVSDGFGGKVSAKIALKVLEANVAPVVNGADVTTLSGRAWTYKVSASDGNKETLTFSLTGAPTGLTVSSVGMLSWAAPVAGTYDIGVTAKDPRNATGSGVIHLVVTQANRAPAVTAATQTATAGQAVSYKIVATDADQDTLTYSISGGPAGMVVSATTGEISWPTSKKGTYRVTMKAADPKNASGSAILALTVN